jgi:FMN reductase
MPAKAPLAVAINGSPSATSRSRRLLDYLLGRLAELGLRTHSISPGNLPAQALLRADAGDAVIAAEVECIAQASIVIIGTPIYKGSYSGLLKTFLDLLPQDGLKDKLVLPLATAGSPAHTLALDYALRPVLAALGAHQLLAGIYATEPQVTWIEDAGLELDPALDARLNHGIAEIVRRLPSPAPQFIFQKPALRVVRGSSAATLSGC